SGDCAHPATCYPSPLTLRHLFMFLLLIFFFFFTDTAPTEIYTLSLHDALPISGAVVLVAGDKPGIHASVLHADGNQVGLLSAPGDRKSTRLNSSHVSISYAVFCLKKKKKKKKSRNIESRSAETTKVEWTQVDSA